MDHSSNDPFMVFEKLQYKINILVVFPFHYMLQSGDIEGMDDCARCCKSGVAFVLSVACHIVVIVCIWVVVQQVQLLKNKHPKCDHYEEW